MEGARGRRDRRDLENWGHDDYKKDYIDRQKVAVEHGITGNKGIIGWYVPPWMAEAHPDIKDWKNLNKYADVMKTPQSGDEVNCSTATRRTSRMTRHSSRTWGSTTRSCTPGRKTR